MATEKTTYVDLCLVRSQQGGLFWVKGPAFRVTTGDLISFQPASSKVPYLGTVEALDTMDEKGNVYRLISHAVPSTKPSAFSPPPGSRRSRMEMTLETKNAILAQEIHRQRRMISRLQEAAGQESEATRAFDAENVELFAVVHRNHEMRS